MLHLCLGTNNMADMTSREKKELIIEILIGWNRNVIINLRVNENAPRSKNEFFYRKSWRKWQS